MNTNQDEPEVAPVTVGVTHGAVYRWAVDVTVPDDWDEEKDRKYANDNLGTDSRDEIVNRLLAILEDYHRVLTFAYCYLRAQPYEPSYSIFRHLPVDTKVAMLRRLFRQRGRDECYLERFDSDLRRFLDVEEVCLPVLGRYLLHPESIWLVQLVRTHDNIGTTVIDFAESLGCEHDDCPRFQHVNRIDRQFPDIESTAPILPQVRVNSQTSHATESGHYCHYRAEANLNLAATVEFIVAAHDVNQARRSAETILYHCEPKIAVGVPTGGTMVVELHPDNVSTELLEIIQDPSPVCRAVT